MSTAQPPISEYRFRVRLAAGRWVSAGVGARRSGAAPRGLTASPPGTFMIAPEGSPLRYRRGRLFAKRCSSRSAHERPISTSAIPPALLEFRQTSPRSSHLRACDGGRQGHQLGPLCRAQRSCWLALPLETPASRQRPANHGERVQRLLFASTRTKDPKAPASSILALAAPNSVNTMP
jgi:hypothetical protein